VGEISVAKPPGDKLSAAEQKLLDDLGSQAGTALRNVGLLIELERRLEEISDQAEELRASRARIVSAQDAERRRLERDLHDGAQQQLVSVSGKLRLLRRLLAENGARAWPLAEELVTEADEALDSVRDLARGIFPQLLAEQGLAVALAARVAKQAPGARLECEPSVAAARFDPRVEAAVYFCCLEALQNAGKHAADAPVVVRLAYERDCLEFWVGDTGPGFDPSAVSGGSGLQNMSDRIAAVGGRLEVRSEVGRGTTVFGLVPAFHGAGRAVAEAAAIPSGLIV
jgi:signal transduction histidine kinase